MNEQILSADRVRIVAGSAHLEEAIRAAGEILLVSGAVTADYVESMLERERSVSTYMGNYLAIPHGTNEGKGAIVRSALSMVRYDEPVDWDGNEVRFVVGIAGLENEHLEILSKIAIIFSDEDEVARLLAAGTAEELFAALSEVNAE